MIAALFNGNLWKFCTGVAGLLTFGLGIALTMAYAENRRIVDMIYNPETGYIAKLARAESNAATLVAGLTRQNESLRESERSAKSQLQVVRLDLDEIRKNNDKLNARLKSFSSKMPTGDTICARYEDVDQRFVETLP